MLAHIKCLFYDFACIEVHQSGEPIYAVFLLKVTITAE